MCESGSNGGSGLAVKYETELYPALKAFWTARGYEVKAEVRGCDLVALRPDEQKPVIVEMKKTFTLALLLQGLERQRTGASVWLAVERNRAKKGAHNQRYAELADMCRRLALGFITVTFYKTKPPVMEVWCELDSLAARQTAAAETRAAYDAYDAAGAAGRGAAGATPPETAAAALSSAPLPVTAAALPPGGRRKGTARLLREFAGRSGDYNVGGSTQRKLVTAYRERALQCALALRCSGEPALAPRQIAALTGVPDAGGLLRSNYYGWFRRTGRGLYSLTQTGRAALLEYSEAVAYWTAKFPWAAEAAADAAIDSPAAMEADAVSALESGEASRP